MNEAISSGKYKHSPKLAALDRLMTTPKAIMLSEMENSPNVTVLEPKAGKSLEDYINKENWQALKHRFYRQGKCYFYYDLGSDFVYIVTKDWLFTISYENYSDKLGEICMYRTSDGSYFDVKKETIADCIIDYLGI